MPAERIEDKALRYAAAFQAQGHVVDTVTISGREVSLKLAQPTERPDQFDSVDFGRDKASTS